MILNFRRVIRKSTSDVLKYFVLDELIDYSWNSFIFIVGVLENCEVVINRMFEISSRGKLDLEEDILATIKSFNCNYETRWNHSMFYSVDAEVYRKCPVYRICSNTAIRSWTSL